MLKSGAEFEVAAGLEKKEKKPAELCQFEDSVQNWDF